MYWFMGFVNFLDAFTIKVLSRSHVQGFRCCLLSIVSAPVQTRISVIRNICEEVNLDLGPSGLKWWRPGQTVDRVCNFQTIAFPHRLRHKN